MSSEESTKERADLWVQVPQRFLERLTAVAAVGLVAANVAREHLLVSWPLIAALGAFAASVFFLARTRRFERAKVEVRRGELLIERAGVTTAISTRSIAHAEVAPGTRGTRLRLLDQQRAVMAELEVESLAEAEAWIAAVGLDLGARELSSDRARLALGENEARGFSLLLVLMSLGAPATLMPALISMTPGIYLWLAKRRIRVGIDGVEQRRWGRRRFHSFSKIKEVIQSDTAVSLVTDEGTIALDLPGDATNRVHRDDVFATVKRAFEAYQKALGSDVTADLLARKGREVGPWLESLSSLGEGKGYRDGAVPKERLSQVLEDPSAEPTSRAAAAWLLTRSGHPEPVQRVIEKTAQLKVRVALDAAMEDDAEELDELTAALERERR